MFDYGDVVSIISGYNSGNEGVIWEKPTEENLNHYIVINEEYPYGLWASENEIVMKFEEDAKRIKGNDLRDAIYAKKLLNEEYDGYIPKDIDPRMFFGEMAEIYPNYNKKNGIKNGFRVWVYPNDGPIPHVHVVFKNGNESYVKLFSAEYLDGHKKKNKELNSSERSDLIKFFKTKIPIGDDDITCWQYAVKEWEMYVAGDDLRHKAFKKLAQKDENGNYIMPDYSEIPYSKKKGENFYDYLTKECTD